MCTKRIRFVKALFSLFIIWLMLSSVAIHATANETDFINENETSSRTSLPREVYLGGFVFGTRIKSDGVLVVDVREVEGAQGIVCPAIDAGIMKGDIIVRVNGKKVTTSAEVSETIQNSLGTDVDVEVLRDGESLNFKITPTLSRDGKTYKSGLFIRDGAAGIGTVTYALPDGSFAGLGHGIADSDTMKLVPFKSGEVFSVTLLGIVKGESGKAGELRGRLDENSIGTLLSNSETGVFGKLTLLPEKPIPVKVADKNEVKEGACEIYTTLDNNSITKAEAKIVKILDKEGKVKNFVIEVTDKALLEKTGGIVQGMSGSPIVQNGKLVGAVTHVFINNSSQGYGIFIENMLSGAE